MFALGMRVFNLNVADQFGTVVGIDGDRITVHLDADGSKVVLSDADISPVSGLPSEDNDGPRCAGSDHSAYVADDSDVAGAREVMQAIYGYVPLGDHVTTCMRCGNPVRASADGILYPHVSEY